MLLSIVRPGGSIDITEYILYLLAICKQVIDGHIAMAEVCPVA